MLSSSYERRIEWGDCDPAGIVFNPNFFAFFDHGTSLLYAAAGWPKPEMLHRFGIAGCPLVETKARFLAPCHYDETVRIESAVSDVRRSSFDIAHRLTRGDTLCVEGFETRVWAETAPDTGRLRSAPIPEEIVTRFRGG